MADKKRDPEQFLSTMRHRFASAQEQESEIRKEARLDLQFAAGEQWNPALKTQREKDGRPALVFNFMPAICQQVSNEAREQKPSVRFGPVDSGSDLDTARVQEGMARSIQRRSHADVAYETAVEYSVAGSFGAFRLATDYCDEKSDRQEIRYEPIMDPFTVYGFLIPAIMRKKPRFGFVIERMSKEEYEAQYPDSELTGMGFAAGAGVADGWVSADDVQVAEYWYTEETREKRTTAGGRDRVITKTKVFSCLTNGVEILPDTETEWVGKRIPVYMTLGPQKIVDGVPKLFSIVRFLRDPQQLINAYKSGIAESIGLMNRVPYIGFKGQFKDPKWQNANVKNYAFLEAEPVMAGGQIAPAPQRQQFEPAIQGMSMAAAQEMEDLKWISSVFDAARGAVSNETSGKAINARRSQSSLANMHFLGNLSRAQIEAGEDLGYMIPLIYDTEQEVRIIGEDEEERIVKVNAPSIDPKTGKTTNYMLESGTYDITVEIGPTTASQREEESQLVGQAIQSAPELMSVMGDLFFRYQDSAGSQEVGDRLKKWISKNNPGLIEEDKQQQIPPQVQQQMQQQGQMLEQVTQQLQIASEELKTRSSELASRERIEMRKLEVRLEEIRVEAETNAAKLGSSEGMKRLELEIESIKHMFQQQQAADMQAADQQHQAEMARQQQQAAPPEAPAAEQDQIAA